MITTITRRKVRHTLTLLAAAAAVLAVVHVPSTSGAFLARITNATDTAGMDPACTAWAQDKTIGPAYFTYPLGDASGAAVDVSGSGNNGSYSTTGITRSQANTGACTQDGYKSVLLDGKAGAIYGPATTSNPSVFTEEIWFDTTTTTGGKLIGLGNSQTGSSGNYDRHLYLDNTGHVVFGVYPGSVQTVISPNTYNNGAWHFAAATLSSAGMRLYVDGTLVASNTSITTAQNFAGYWRIGYDNLANWGTTTPTSYYYKGYLAWAAVYTTALTATQIANQYAAGT